MGESKRRRQRAKIKKRYRMHWRRLFYLQAGAYAVVLLIWLIPLPNPIKLLAITFHELSHGLAALLTGGRVFGIAIDPSGAGVTMGIGGHMFTILIAGYLGSALWGTALYVVSVRWRANTALIALELLVIGSTLLGWLNSYTVVFGVGSLLIMTALFPMADTVKQFFIQMVGSACCLYAPLEILGEVISRGGGPSVKGVKTGSDIAQLAELTGIHAVIIGAVLVLLQSAWLIVLIRWTCRSGAVVYLRTDLKKARRKHTIHMDLHPEKKVYRLK